MRNRVVFLLIALIIFPNQIFALENLDELETRSGRRATRTFYSGENSGNAYIWQTQTITYVDTSSNHEVTIFTQSNGNDVVGLFGNPEYGWAPWSADGKRIMWPQQYSTVGCYTRDYGWPWMISRSDGSYLRPLCESANRTNSRTRYGTWSPVEPDVFFAFGYNNNGNTGLDENGLYRHVAEDDNVTYGSVWVDMIPANTTTDAYDAKQGISGDGRIFWSTSGGDGVLPGYVARVYPSGSQGLIVTWSSAPALDSYWEDNPGGNHADFHDECLGGNAAIGYWLYGIVPDGGTTWWRYRPWGTDNGVPNHVSDQSSPYDWWDADSQSPDEWDSNNDIPGDANKEIQCVNTRDASNVPDHVGAYWSHGMCDRWGQYTAFSDTETDPAPYGPSQWNVVGEAELGHYESTNTTVQYNVWAAWSDWSVHSITVAGESVSNTLITLKTDDSAADIVHSHSSVTGDFADIGQSPDGTKANINSDWLDDSDLLIGVAYYPHPPEITDCNATGGTVTATFEWMLDSTPRGYTTRGWPDPAVDDPPPPRETEFFRLWRCSGTCTATSGTWTPIGTTNAEIFTRYDFADGTWDGNDYWTITDAPGDGTWYYAVTSKEWSGLESRALSNIFSITVSSGSGTGSQSVAYPSSPGDLDNISASDFHTSFSTSATNIIRAYNIYAADGGAPSIQQQDIVATFPVGSCSGGSCQWVDWLGATDETTQYIVAAVDTQGNISASNFVTSQSYTSCEGSDCSAISPEPTAEGQYLVEWDDMYSAYEAGPTPTPTPGTSTISAGSTSSISAGSILTWGSGN